MHAYLCPLLNKESRMSVENKIEIIVIPGLRYVVGDMAANKKVGACNDPLLETSKCGYCRSSNGLKCSICPKVFHPSCSMKLKKCCDVEITEILITDKVSEETTIMEPKSTDITILV
ncbi:hypothetical protein WA026_023286 [Henosepilachna vigintioctopunctata]|uniref:Phorbol-ester/DAG-type domain-containing protein n=1 Tax=Henosepilachna vigintioctopunctata TaxID=420089 RepID=A0AAW1U6Q5_9CUCU